MPTTRPYVEQYLEQAYERETLLEHFGTQYAQLAHFLYSEIDRSAAAVVTAQQAREDLERGVTSVADIQQGHYLLHWGRIVQRLGNPRQGLAMIERALALAQEQDQSLRVHALNNMAVVYQSTGQQALHLYEQALSITREVGGRDGEAETLNNMALVYRATGQLQQALDLYEQALLITREVGDRAGEATILTNMAEVYRATGQLQQALDLYEQALPITREVGNRAGEATTVNNMAEVYRTTGQTQQALHGYEQALPIMREVNNRAGEAITHLEQAITVLVNTSLPQDAGWHKIEDLQQWLHIMRTGDSPGAQAFGSATMPAEQLQQIIGNTVAVMTTMQDRHAEWREVIVEALKKAQSINRPQDAELFSAILNILDEQPLSLSPNYPYAQALAAIQQGIAGGA